jgi:hypothetical protein
VTASMLRDSGGVVCVMVVAVVLTWHSSHHAAQPPTRLPWRLAPYLNPSLQLKPSVIPLRTAHPHCRCDGPLLSAVKSGAWVLLDELNLAGQSVLEGLNGLLDHRAALFVPELGQSFKAHPQFRWVWWAWLSGCGGAWVV